MNTALKLLILVSVIPIFLWSSCQQEIEPITVNIPDQVITPDAEVADLIKRITMKDGSADNIIDHASCISLMLPYTVVVNGVKLIIENPEDVHEAERIIDRHDDDEDDIEIIFPITVILPDYTELIINNEEELEDLADNCTENEPDNDMECIDFVYPFGISVFDTLNQSLRVLTIENDRDLHNFFIYPGKNEVSALSFPVFLIDFNGKTVHVRNNQELKDCYKAAENICDEDDDNDYDDDDVNIDYFTSILMYGEWDNIVHNPIGFLQENNPFYRSTFNFHDEGIVEIMKSDQFWEGTWSANGDAGWIQLKLEFGDDPPFNLLSNDWRVIYYYPTYIFISLNEFEEGSSSQIARDVLAWGELDPMHILREGMWVVKSYTNYGEDKTVDYEGISIDFETGGEIVVFKDNEVKEDTCSWEIVDSTVEDIYMGMVPLRLKKFILDFGELSPMNEFNNKNWDIADIDYFSLEFFYFDSESGIITDVLILERQ